MFYIVVSVLFRIMTVATSQLAMQCQLLVVEGMGGLGDIH